MHLIILLFIGIVGTAVAIAGHGDSHYLPSEYLVGNMILLRKSSVTSIKAGEQ